MTEHPNFPEICQEGLSEALRPELFKAMSDPVRVSIIAILATRSGFSTVSEIAETCGIDFSGVSRHLKILREAEIVTAEKQGRAMLYCLNTKELVQTLHGLAASLTHCSEQAKR